MRAAVLCCALLSIAALGGCAAPPPPVGPGTIAVVLPTEDDRFGDVADVLRERLEGAGFEVVVQSTDGDFPAQVDAVADLLKDDLDALVVWPIDGTSLTTVVDAAQPGTRIVALGGLVYDTARLDDYVAFDAAAAGYLQATDLLQGLGLDASDDADASDADDDEPRTLELFVGSPDNAATEPGYAAIMGVLQPYLDSGDITIGSGDTSLADVSTLRGNEETAASRMTQILRDDYPEGAWPDAVLATSDEIARGVSTALLDAGAAPGAAPGEEYPLITGRGAQLQGLVALLEGRQFSTILEDPRALADATADLLLATPAPTGATIDNGAAAIRATLVQPVAVRAETIDQLVIGSGYWTRARLDEAIAQYGSSD